MQLTNIKGETPHLIFRRHSSMYVITSVNTQPNLSPCLLDVLCCSFEVSSIANCRIYIRTTIAMIPVKNFAVKIISALYIINRRLIILHCPIINKPCGSRLLACLISSFNSMYSKLFVVHC